jgi:hypothetical protein
MSPAFFKTSDFLVINFYLQFKEKRPTVCFTRSAHQSPNDSFVKGDSLALGACSLCAEC